MTITIRGLQKAQAMNARAIAAVSPEGAMGEALQIGTAALHRYAVSITHVDTGSLRASHRMMIDWSQTRGRVYISPSARNPRSFQKPSVYGVYEHDRGGSHAFYERTANEVGSEILRNSTALIVGAIR